jgi:hypothetical protein
LEKSSKSENVVPETTMVIYGGKREDVGQALESVLGLGEDDYYQTWVSLGVMKRLGFLFEGGVESSGSLTGVVCMFAVLILVLALFAFWNLIVVFITLLVLTLLSGGAALKFARGTYVTATLDKLDTSQLEAFVNEQVVLGRFVYVKDTKDSPDLTRSSLACHFFRRGIQFSLLVATVFLVVEVFYWLINAHFLSGLDPVTGPTETFVLLVFGLVFLVGVMVIDLGVILRYRLSKQLKGRVTLVD